MSTLSGTRAGWSAGSGRAIWIAGALAVGVIAVLALYELGVMGVRILRHPPAAPGWFGLGATLAVIILLAAASCAAALLPSRLEKDRWPLLVGLAMVAGIRLLIIVAVDAPLSVDAVAYRDLAVAITHGSCCFADRAAGYPWLLAPFYAMVGVQPAVHELINLAFALLGGAALYAIAREEFGIRTASVALVLFALCPSLALLTPVALTETVDIGLLLIALWTARRAMAGSLPMAAATGGLMAAAQYVRPVTSILFVGLLVALLAAGPRLRESAVRVLVTTACFLIVLTPVAAYNFARFGDLSISTSSYGGAVLYIGTNQETDGRTSTALAETIRTVPGDTQWERSLYLQDLAVRRIVDDPAGIAELSVRKLPVMWGDENYGARFALGFDGLRTPAGASLVLMSQLFYAVVAMAAVGGLVLLRASSSPVLQMLLMLVIMGMTAHLLLEVKPRYHAWAVPLLILLAAPVIQEGWTRLAGWGGRGARALAS